jgi:phosphate-selective porin
MRRSLICLLFVGFSGLAGPGLLDAQSLGVIKPAGKEPTISIGGLLQVQAEAGDKGDSRFNGDNDRFYLRRARLNATGKFLEEFDFRLEGEFAGTLSNTSGLRAQLTDAYVTWNRYPGASVRFGQFKTPYGFEQLYSDPRLFALERSLVNDRLTLSRQLGVQAGGDFLEKCLTYAVGAFNGNGVNNNFNDDDRFLVAGRLSGIPWQGKVLNRRGSWSLGGNAYSSDDTNISPGSEFGFDSTPATPDRDGIFSGKRVGYGLDTQIQWGPVDLWVEALQTKWEPDSRRPLRRIESKGWYAQGSVFVIPDKLQAVAKHETFDPRDELPNDRTETDTVGLNWMLKGHDLKLGLDYLRTRIEGQDNQDKVLARFQVIF